MDTVGLIFFIIGFIIIVIYGLKLALLAFEESTAWGLIYLFVPFANLYYVITRWEKCRSPFLKSLIGLPFFAVSFYLISNPMGGPGYQML